MEKVKQIVLFVKRQTHERRHLGFVGNLTEETFFYVIYTLRLICTQITILWERKYSYLIVLARSYAA